MERMENGGGMLEAQVNYHKGQPCIIRPETLCQEGYCATCAIMTQHARDYFNGVLAKFTVSAG
jgi:hypothetical protein